MKLTWMISFNRLKDTSIFHSPSTSTSFTVITEENNIYYILLSQCQRTTALTRPKSTAEGPWRASCLTSPQTPVFWKNRRAKHWAPGPSIMSPEGLVRRPLWTVTGWHSVNGKCECLETELNRISMRADRCIHTCSIPRMLRDVGSPISHC